MKKYIKGIGFYILLLAVIFLIYSLISYKSGPTTKGFSDLVNQINSGNVTELQITENVAVASLKDGTIIKSEIPSLDALYEHAGDQIKKQVNDHTLTYTAPQPNVPPWWLSMLPSIILMVVIIVFWVYFFKQSQGGAGGRGAMSFGKSKAKVSVNEKDPVTFRDVAGADVEKAELAEVVEFLKDPMRFEQLGAKIPRGVLLVGPPGTGKTLLAKAVAGEAGVPFFSISGSDFVEMFVGVGASRVRDLFEQAKKAAPSIVFIDDCFDLSADFTIPRSPKDNLFAGKRRRRVLTG